MKKHLWLLFLVACAYAQPKIPLIAGAQLESGIGSLPGGKTGTGVVRILPYLGVWLPGMGYGKLGATYFESSSTDSNGVEYGWEERDYTIQLGVTFGGPQRPYLLGSYTSANQLSDIGDADWTEWGLGLGAIFPIGGMSAITMEAEYRWIEEHFEAVRNRNVEGTRIQLNLGFLVYLY